MRTSNRSDCRHCSRKCRRNHLEPPYTDPYVRWCGRGRRVTAAPMPINERGFSSRWAFQRRGAEKAERSAEKAGLGCLTSWICGGSHAPNAVYFWGFLRPVFAFLSLRSFHAVRSAPVSISWLAAARRMWVCPIFPQPPGMGRKMPGASCTNAVCCSRVSIRFP
jgi:hypothetical protein